MRIGLHEYVSMFINGSTDTHCNLSDKKVIPKFPSFQANVRSKSTNQGLETSGCSESLDTTQQSLIAISRVKPLHHKHDRDHSRSRLQPGSENQGKDQPHIESSTVQCGVTENTSDIFVVDKLGDSRNLTFGTLNRYSIPSYFRSGAGAVVGSTSGQKIDRDISSEKGLVLTYSNLTTNVDRYSRRRLVRYKTQEPERKLSRISLPAIDAAANFVPLITLHQEEEPRGDDGSCAEIPFSEAEGASYRSVKGKAKPQDDSDGEDLLYFSDSYPSADQEGDVLSATDETFHQQRIELSKNVHQHPTNCRAWINLIESHDRVLCPSKPPKKIGLTDAERLSNADVKLSLYEKALEKVTNLEDREELLLGMMEEASTVWQSNKLFSRWQSILECNSRYSRLRTAFLNFRQVSSSSFHYESVRDVYLECLTLLEQACDTTEEGTIGQRDVLENQIYTILRVTVLMRESGFSEHAIAVWQALLEYRFYKPDNFQGPGYERAIALPKTQISAFEAFWDSEVPRIGENDSRGWKTFYQQSGKQSRSPAENVDSLTDDPEFWLSWLNLERKCDLLARNPARTIDDVEANDPYRVILFSDIHPFLVNVITVDSEQAILSAFLIFCQLPPLRNEGSSPYAKHWSSDAFLRNETLNLGGTMSGIWNFRNRAHPHFLSRHSKACENITEESSSVNVIFDVPSSTYQVSSDTLFTATGSWFSAFHSWQSSVVKDEGPLESTFVLQVLKSLVTLGVGGTDLAEYFLALEVRLSPKTVKKTARYLLKKTPSNLRLYNAYALIEYRLGNQNKGENMLITSINMSKTLNQLAQQDAILLWRTWIWEMLDAGKSEDVNERLLSYADDQIPSALPAKHHSEMQEPRRTLQLRTERKLLETRDSMLSLGKNTLAIYAMECFILFSYVQSAQLLSAAISAFRSNLTLFSQTSRRADREHLHQNFARLLYYHVTHTQIFKPLDIRFLLAESIAEFPQNTIFISLYSWNEARFRIDDRVRVIVKEVVLANDESKEQQPESVVPHFFALYTELNRGVTFGSNNSTIRSTFERAVSTKSVKHCAGLWKWYFLFECSRGDMEKAKAVYWRGLRACPWVKELYLLAFEYLRDVMTEADLRGIYELLGEKDLRVHIGLEDHFRDRDERKKTS